MKVKRVLTIALASTMLVAAGCGGSDSGDSGQGGSGKGGSGNGKNGTSTKAEPATGVPAGTSPLPLPETGKPYDNPQPRSKIKDGGTLTLPITEIGPNFNQFSADGNSLYVHDLMRWVAPELWNYSITGEVKPNKDYLLSTKLVSKKPETVKYTLNPKAKWNDGTPIDWRTFKTTWKTQSGNDKHFAPASTVGYDSIKSVEKGKKDNEVIVTFKNPFYPYQLIFAQIEHPKNGDPKFYKKGWIKDMHPELLAGPFTVAKQSPEKVVFKPNPKWWGDEPKLDKVIYRQMEDSASINAFQNGEIDETSVGNADRLKQISGMKNVMVRRGFAKSTSVYTMGQDSTLFKDKAARKAFELGTDRATLAKIRFQGMNWKEEPPGSSLTYPWQDTYEDNLSDMHYNADKAKKVLDSIGWKMGDDGYRHKDGKIAKFTFVTFGDDPTGQAMARAQQKMSKEIGLKMVIDNRKNSDFSPTITKGTYDVVAMGWSGTDPFGYAWGCQLYCSESDSNYPGLGNKKLDKKLHQVTTIADQEKAAKVGNAAEREALHLFGTFPLYNGPTQIAVKKGLANYGPSGFLMRPKQDIGWEK